MTNVLLVGLVLSVAAVAFVLARGLSTLNHHLENAIHKSLSPTIGIFADLENTIALVNVGGGVAINIEWSIPDSQQSGSISYLSPEQTWHVPVRKDATERLLIRYNLSPAKSSSAILMFQKSRRPQIASRWPDFT